MFERLELEKYCFILSSNFTQVHRIVLYC